MSPLATETFTTAMGDNVPRTCGDEPDDTVPCSTVKEALCSPHLRG